MKEKYAEHYPYLSRAIELAKANIQKGGGPFGAVIARNGQIIAEGTNSVTVKNDPTAHAEIEAIRQATGELKNWQLDDCILYSSCEPCPMCLGATYWAGIKEVYFASTRDDAEKAGFSDALIYREIDTPIQNRQLPTINLKTENTGTEFEAWHDFDSKITY